MLAAKNNGFLNLEIEGDSKIVVDSYNRKINIYCVINGGYLEVGLGSKYF